MTEEFWNVILSTNLVGPFRCVHAAAAQRIRSNGLKKVNPAGYRMVERPVEFTEKCVDPTRQVPPIRPSSVRSPNAGG